MVVYIVIFIAYTLLVATSGKVVGFLLKATTHQTLGEIAKEDVEAKEKEAEKRKRIEVGSIIGKCENIIILTFIILEAYTALALVVTAKTIVRKEEIEKNTMFFLAGTLANVSYSVFVGFIVKLVLLKLNFHTAFK